MLSRFVKPVLAALLVALCLTSCGAPKEGSSQSSVNEPANKSIAPTADNSSPQVQAPNNSDKAIYIHCSYIPNGQGSNSLYEAEFKIDGENGSFGTYDGASNAYQNGLFPYYTFAGPNPYVIQWRSGHSAELSEEYIKIYDGDDKEIDYEINRSSGFLIWSANTLVPGFVLGVCQSSSNQIKGKLF